MRDIREKFMLLDVDRYDRELLQLLDMMIWRMEEFDNRIRGQDRVIQELLTR